MRCPDCNTFVAYGEPRTDEIEVEVSEDGTITLRGPLYLTCEQCGTDLKSCELEAEDDASNHFDTAGEDEGTDVNYEASGDPEIEATDRTQTTDRNGKPIKKTRYMRRFYGVSAEITVTRTFVKDGKETTDEKAITLTAEEQASAFDEC